MRKNKIEQSNSILLSCYILVFFLSIAEVKASNAEPIELPNIDSIDQTDQQEKSNQKEQNSNSVTESKNGKSVSYWQSIKNFLGITKQPTQPVVQTLIKQVDAQDNDLEEELKIPSLQDVNTTQSADTEGMPAEVTTQQTPMPAADAKEVAEQQLPIIASLEDDKENLEIPSLQDVNATQSADTEGTTAEATTQQTPMPAADAKELAEQQLPIIASLEDDKENLEIPSLQDVNATQPTNTEGTTAEATTQQTPMPAADAKEVAEQQLPIVQARSEGDKENLEIPSLQDVNTTQPINTEGTTAEVTTQQTPVPAADDKEVAEQQLPIVQASLEGDKENLETSYLQDINATQPTNTEGTTAEATTQQTPVPAADDKEVAEQQLPIVQASLEENKEQPEAASSQQVVEQQVIQNNENAYNNKQSPAIKPLKNKNVANAIFSFFKKDKELPENTINSEEIVSEPVEKAGMVEELMKTDGLSLEQAQFVSNEIIMLSLPNDDVVLGELSEERKLLQMDHYYYLSALRKANEEVKYNIGREKIDSFIVTVH